MFGKKVNKVAWNDDPVARYEQMLATDRNRQALDLAAKELRIRNMERDYTQLNTSFTEARAALLYLAEFVGLNSSGKLTQVYADIADLKEIEKAQKKEERAKRLSNFAKGIK